MDESNRVEESLDVVVVGNIGVDTNVFVGDREIDLSHEGHFSHNFDYVGQAGGFTSRGYAQLGYRTAIIGHVGEDWAGRLVREELAGDRVDTEALFTDPAGTCRSVNLMLDGGERRNFYDGKSHMELDPDPAACRRVLARARMAHFHLSDWARRLLPTARELGLTVACDLQDIRQLDDPYRRDFMLGSDLLFFSAAHASNAEDLLRRMMELVPEKVLVTGMGAQGCALGRDGRVKQYPAVDQDSPVVDTNGAGDGLAVGFLAAHVLEGRSFDEAILRGQITARHTCSIRASSSGLIRRQELDARVAAVRARES